jgi:hypothetical protein
MATAVGIMDAPGLKGNTDVLVVADPSSARLLWVPRDLWCDRIRDRVNQAFALGGHDELRLCLAEHGLEVEHGLCLGRLAVERALEGVAVEVALSERLEFWYPADPRAPIEEGRRRISFEPPGEVLRAERLHQWLGARYPTVGTGSDMDRIERQQRLLSALLRHGFDPSPAFADPDEISATDPAALDELRGVDSAWQLETFGADAVPTRIDGKLVLVR